MSLHAGDKLGPYEIISPVGRGGMGEVYRASDTRLGREVAIKMSAEQFTERFQREARAVASLNHPNVCQLYDVGPDYLVMEFVEGEPPKGPMPVEEALRYARQIADALAEAHDKGIVHRDLKPANIRIRPDGTVKVLDFGLAKIAQAAPGDVEHSPTLSMQATQAGVVLGTAAYMSPEQARGKPVDKRADIWAFGVVFYEMLTGKRLFQGEDVTETMAAVVKEEPDLSAVPPNVRRVIARCLEKDPRKRLRDISGVNLLLEQHAAPVATSGATRAMWVWPAGVAAAALAAAGATWLVMRPSTQPLRPLIRLEVDLGETVSLTSGPIISPDESRLAFVSVGRLFALRLDQPKAAPAELPGAVTLGGQPFFSPDGKWIGFFSPGLNKMAVDGGAPVPLAAAPANARGASWGDDGSIVAAFGTNTALSRVSDAGGEPESLTELAAGETSHRWPQILPNRRGVLFTAGSGSWDAATVDVLDLNDRQRKTVQRGGSYGRYVTASDGTGYLTFVNRGTLFAAPFDLEQLEVLDTPVPVLDEVGYNPSDGIALLDFSKTGTLVYRSGLLTGARVVHFMDAAGKTEPVLLRPDSYVYPRLSPDGEKLSIVATEGGTQDVWVYDVRGGRSSRLTIGVGATFAPIWSPDGRYILFQGPGGIFWTRSDGASQPQLLTESKVVQYPWSFTADGKRLAYMEAGFDLWTVPVEADGTGLKAGVPEKFLATTRDERHPSFSPDGRWIAYASDETGRFQVYVRAFPDTGGRWTVSSNGGHYPVWSQDGRNLFYRTEEGQVMVARYTAKQDAFVADPPRPFSDRRLYQLPLNGTYDVAPDGRRIVGLFPLEAPSERRAQRHVVFLLNFADEIRRRVGTGDETD
jgi:serine/threonine-protein kinase